MGSRGGIVTAIDICPRDGTAVARSATYRRGWSEELAYRCPQCGHAWRRVLGTAEITEAPIVRPGEPTRGAPVYKMPDEIAGTLTPEEWAQALQPRRSTNEKDS